MEEITDLIYSLEQLLVSSVVRSSREKLDILLADDFQECGTSGKMYTKVDVLQRLPSSTDTTKYVITDFSAKEIAAGIVLATYKTTRTTNEKEVTVSLRCSLWRNEEGVWRIFFHQGTTV